jgi:nucleotide-binding universal stress UspA family protein
MFGSIRKPPVNGIERILVPTDLKEESLPAIRHGISVAMKHRAELLVLHVVGDDPRLISAMMPLDSEMLALRPWFPIGVRERDMIDNRLRERERMLCDFLSRHFGPEESWPVKIVRLVMAGDVGEEIGYVARQKECDLIVMAARDRGWLARKILGSVSRKVARTAPCPVAIIHPSGALRQKGRRAPIGPLVLGDAPNRV